MAASFDILLRFFYVARKSFRHPISTFTKAPKTKKEAFRPAKSFYLSKKYGLKWECASFNQMLMRIQRKLR
ncbi:hypothetical protein [Planomicrobium okeanokoites]|uniref:hypothetical protein n=1 Tax=Planomicrobium okeanokoites TaxID=244 RepID=UPI000A012952|nr:hypothetical protein [Planomicrobium okeanokoites]